MPKQAVDEYDRLRYKRAKMLHGGDAVRDANDDDPYLSQAIRFLTDTAFCHWKQMNPPDECFCLWGDLADTAISAQLTANYKRIKEMAIAFTTAGSPLFGDADLREAIIWSLDWMYENRYNELSVKYDNWWDWDIGVPLQLNDAMVLMYDWLGLERLSRYAAAIDRCMPAVTMTGANRLWAAAIVGIRGIVVKDGAKIAAARDGLDDIYPDVTAGDGYYADGSFVQHRHYAYTGGYGISLLQHLSDLMYLLHDSRWAVTNPEQDRVYTWVYDAYRPLLYKGAMMDMTRGREISRCGMEDHDAGHQVMQAIGRMAQFAPAKEASDFRSMIKAWVREDTYSSFYRDAPIDLIQAVKVMMNDSGIQAAEPFTAYRQFPAMDRAVCRRPGFGLAIAMYSERISSYESINRENLRGWYTGFGATYLYNDDLGQFSEGFWPTVNAYRMPGTTVLTRTALADHKSSADWVGGTDLDGMYGTCGMEVRIGDGSCGNELKGVNDAGDMIRTSGSISLTARKSWFMFEEEVVALGAGIASQSGIAAETVVENRKLDQGGKQQVRIEGGFSRNTGSDWQHNQPDVQWAHLSGPVPGSNIGYYFPQSVRLMATCELRTGSWNEINERPEMPTAAISNRYLTLWLDHGIHPTGESYAYVLLPNKTCAEVAYYADHPGIVVLENSTEAQAVKAERLQIVAVNFWQHAVKTVDRITCDSKASVMFREADGELQLSVSDPTMKNAGWVRIEWAGPAEGIIEADPAISVLQLHPVIRLAVNVGGARGRAFKAKFAAFT